MKNIFQLKGRICQTVYSNKECFFPDSRGLYYIRQLLTLKSGESLGVTELTSRAPGKNGPVARPEQAQGIIQAILDGEVNDQSSYSPDYLLSAQDRTNIENALAAKQEQLTQAENGVANAELADEIDTIETYLKNARSDIRFTDREKRDRSSVKNAIKRAIKEASQCNSDLARHLRNSIRTGYSCSYEPETPTEWTT